MSTEARAPIAFALAVLIVGLLYLLWWDDQPENWPVSDGYYKSGKAPDVPRRWLP